MIAARASRLRDEALELLRTTELLKLVADKFGSVALVGSVDLDLMTWRDIDIYAPVERSQKDEFLKIAADAQARFAATGVRLIRAVFNDEWIRPRGDYGSGHYWGLRVRDAAGEEYKIDLWGWEPSTFSTKVDDHARLKRALEGCDRGLVLQLKHEAMRDPGFRKTLTSWDVYQIVLGGGTSL